MPEFQETLHSIHAAASDIQRWTLQMASKGRVSIDRKNDMRHQAHRLLELVAKL